MLDQKKIFSSSQLPTLPGVALRLLELSKKPDAEVRDLIDIIRTDPAISAKVLKLANSSYFGLKSEVKSLDRAVPLLGTTVVTSLALSFSLVESSMPSGPLGAHYKDYWVQSLVQATAAELLGSMSSAGADCEYFQAGLLTDIGQLALLRTLGNDYCQVLETARDKARPLQDVERDVLGINHIETGLRLAETWNLPSSLVETIRLHHATIEQFQQAAEPNRPLVRAILVASTVGEYVCSSRKGLAFEQLKQLARDLYGFAGARLNDLIAKVNARTAEMGRLLSIDTTDLMDPAELMAQANEQLSELAMREHAANAQAQARQQTAERERQELESRNRNLQQQAIRDPLTKLYNRHFFDETLRNEVRRCARTASPIALVFLDVDRFKSINDTYGHPFGDQVLQRVAQVLLDSSRRSDVVARYGGEEFVLLALQPTEKGLRKLAERIRANIEAMTVACGETRVPITASLGVAISIPNRDDDSLADQLVTAADEAMYESKRDGRNRVTVRCLLDERERHMLQQVLQHRFSRWLVSRSVLDVTSASRALLETETPHVRIGDLAMQQGRLTATQIARVLDDQNRTNARFGEAALKLGFLTESQLAQLLALQQEEPVGLARTLVRRGMLDWQQIATLLAEYLNANSTRISPPSPAATLA